MSFARLLLWCLSDEALLKKPVPKKAAVAKISKTGKGVKDQKSINDDKLKKPRKD
jgi:hypothetical protein